MSGLLLVLSSSTIAMSSQQPAVVVGLGELLWDVFSPSKRLLGGAPANFAYHALCMGDAGVVASRVGSDQLGREATDILSSRAVDTQHIQQSAACPTGCVSVTLSAKGEASYVIELGAAWDEMELTPDWLGLAASADAVCYGSLAQRSAASRAAISGFLAHTRPSCVRVFDVNLRQHFYDAESLTTGLRAATIAKLNDEEAQPVVACLNPADCAPDSLEGCAMRLLESFANLQLVVVTRAAQGSTLVSRTSRISASAVKAEPLVDTVGAGDAYTAALVHSLLGKPIGELSDGTLASAAAFASHYAAHVCKNAGAMPLPPEWLSAELALLR